jgi:hypothetical protein
MSLLATNDEAMYKQSVSTVVPKMDVAVGFILWWEGTYYNGAIDGIRAVVDENCEIARVDND